VHESHDFTELSPENNSEHDSASSSSASSSHDSRRSQPIKIYQIRLKTYSGQIPLLPPLVNTFYQQAKLKKEQSQKQQQQSE